MKIKNLQGNYVSPQNVFGKFNSITCGETGRGRKLGFIPLCRELQEVETLDKEYDIVKTKNKGNLLIVPSEKAEGLIVITNWYGGFRGTIESNIDELIKNGNVEILVDGATAEGDAGRMGGENQYIFKVLHSCKIEYHKCGRVYGDPRNWIANIDLEHQKVEEYPAESDIDLDI